MSSQQNNRDSDFGKCLDYGKERISAGWCKDCEINVFKENLKIGQVAILILIILSNKLNWMQLGV